MPRSRGKGTCLKKKVTEVLGIEVGLLMVLCPGAWEG